MVGSIKNKKRRRRIGLMDFTLGHGVEPYNLKDDLWKQGPNLN